MKKLIVTSILLILTAGGVIFSCHTATPAPEKVIAQTLLAQVDSFSALAGLLQARAGDGLPEDKRLQDLFLQTRQAYKSFEWAAEYFVPATSRFVNGPPVQEVEMAGQQVFEPAGLQVIEGFLFPKYDSSRKKELIRQLTRLRSDCDKYRTHFANIDIFDWQVFDAAKLEIFRIETLGIAGFDNPLSGGSMPESAASFESLKKVLANYAGKEDPADLMGKFDQAVGYLRKNRDFNSFDRAIFITAYCNPLSVGLTAFEEKLKIHVIRYNRLLNQDAKTLFDSNAFNANAYAPDPASFLSDEKIALGKVLFADPSLSGTGTRSCQSCHQPGKAFTDGLEKNTSIGNDKLLKRNTPTLINAALQPSQFYDLRVNTLEDQSRNVVQNILEMHGSMDLSVKRLWEDSTYRQLFSAAFPKKDRAAIDTLEVMNAIGSYVRSLVMLDSRFDQYMRGNSAALNTGEINGFNLFMGKAKCGTCHYMPLFNGTFPPRYVRTESEVIGVPEDTIKKKIDGDMGRYEIIRIGAFKHAFKIPTLRNAARTAPYMHNGVFTSLRQVMDFYNKGGGTGLGLKLDNQTLPFDKLDLTSKESNDIIAFIGSLDSR
jgi:cytochrome c peroxidase